MNLFMENITEYLAHAQTVCTRPLLGEGGGGEGTGNEAMLEITLVNKLLIRSHSYKCTPTSALKKGPLNCFLTLQLQYVFIHDALEELITCGETDISAGNLRVKVNKLHKIIPGKAISGFEDQFRVGSVKIDIKSAYST